MQNEREQLVQAIEAQQQVLNRLNEQLAEYDSAPERHIYSSLEEAQDELVDFLREQAAEDCEGSYNCGSDYYEQEFIVDGVHYIGRIDVEYNRHDKTYYFIEESRYSYVPK
jgi:hypothetical protein